MKTHLGRRPFTVMELHTLFSGYIYSDSKLPREQAKHWHFWLPVLAYYTGAYSDEISRLTLNDIIEINTKSYFHFHTNGKIKSRLIPIHNGLIQAGFNDFIKYLKTQNQTRLMFDLPAKSGRYSEKVRIWFSGEGERAGYLQKCGIPNVDHDGRKAAISSFRLNFEQQVRIFAIQAKNKNSFHYLLGFNEYISTEYDDKTFLTHIVDQLRQLPEKVSWQRFINREKA
ncbi:hypothetical protein [Pseudoalteromonas denitrificans]|uniref:Phage integrase family protein n=1 Tax=Pseudoalteromonas denitrificans DSM 6059 TaxID=1123010 RepID=A0A1I1J6G1_9GAMM|nr:hypothetical protein [Pseudoalteromonas denitrificans]SFC41533.1 hypothetical protein SAMN02745724_01595 [Pseudoalteromonas denitrificans DSM 6059]